MAATIETISVKLVKEVVNEISTRVSESNEEMRATEKEVAASVRVLSFRSFVGKTWSYIYKMFGKEKKILANDVVLRKVSVFGKDFETVEYSDGRLMTLPDRMKYASWRDFLSRKIDSLAVRHEVIPLGISRNGVFAGKPQLEP